MKIAFRTDASLQMGSGHVMRCLTLADALTARGAQCHFISRAHTGHLLELIHQRGYKVNSLLAPADIAQAAIKKISSSAGELDTHSHQPPEPAHAAWLGSTWQADATDTAAVLAGLQPDWLVRFAPGLLYVAPHAQEATGDNAIPQALAAVCAAVWGGTAENAIVQSDRVYHTGADAMERMAARAQFVGAVQPGERYVLVDDVTSLGGTLAELANHIQHGGGKIQDVVVLVNAGRNPALVPQPKNVQLLNRRFGDEIFNIFGIKPAALTANEAHYLVGFRSVDEIRNRLVAARQEIDRRLRSKGIARAFEGTATGLHAVQSLSVLSTPAPVSKNKLPPHGS